MATRGRQVKASPLKASPHSPHVLVSAALLPLQRADDFPHVPDALLVQEAA